LATTVALSFTRVSSSLTGGADAVDDAPRRPRSPRDSRALSSRDALAYAHHPKNTVNAIASFLVGANPPPLLARTVVVVVVRRVLVTGLALPAPRLAAAGVAVVQRPPSRLPPALAVADTTAARARIATDTPRRVLRNRGHHRRAVADASRR